MKSRFYIFHFYIDIRTKGALAPKGRVIKAWGIAPGHRPNAIKLRNKRERLKAKVP